VVAYRAGAPVLVSQFLSDVRHLARSFPPCTHVLNACADRYHFTVGLAAALASGRVSLLPSSQAPEMLRQLCRFAPDVICLSDEAEAGNGLPRMSYPRERFDASADPPPSLAACGAPEADEAQLVAYVFTSGSTGTPLHPRPSGV
jgi:hypothetical protein